MDKNNFDQLGFPVNGDEEPEDFGATREMSSIQENDDFSDIAPRERFTELNSADEPGSTRMMDSLTDVPGETQPTEPANPVRKRKKRKKKKPHFNHTRTMGHIFLGVVRSVSASVLSWHGKSSLPCRITLAWQRKTTRRILR